ncbi:MAG: RNA methyltransferase [Firmicutes bacterium]|nr:RNA methyltransferase [Bacillota bacterium]
MLITSKQNSSFKLWVRLKQKKYRDIHGMFLVYGNHLIEQAKKHQVIVDILTSEPNQEGIQLTADLMNDLQQAETYFDLIAVCKKSNPIIKSDKILVLDDVQDPDNVGALLRSASAFGFVHVIASLKTADLYNEKVIRASKGAFFDVYVERRPLYEALVELKALDYQLIYADAHETGIPQKHKKTALIMGNEGHGIHDEIKNICDGAVCIPTQNVESLNVSVAGGILMYEWRNL